MGEADKTEHMKEKRLEREGLQQGTKRKFEEAAVEKADYKKTRTTADDVDLYETFRDWAIGEKTLYPELKMADLEQRWNKRFLDPNCDYIERDGERLIRRFRGVECRSGLEEGSEARVVQKAVPNSAEGLDIALSEATAHVDKKYQRLQQEAKASDGQCSAPIQPSQIRASPRKLGPSVSPLVVALMAKRDLADKQLEEAVEMESAKRDMREAMLYKQQKQEAAKHSPQGEIKKTHIELKLQAVQLKQSMCKAVDAFVSGVREKVEIVEEHGKELGDYESVLTKIAIMREHYANLQAAVAQEKKIIEDFVQEGMDADNLKIAIQNLEGHKKDDSMASVRNAMKAALRAAQKEIENPTGAVEVKASPGKKKVDSGEAPTEPTLRAELLEFMRNLLSGQQTVGPKLDADLAALKDQGDDQGELGKPVMLPKLSDMSNAIRTIGAFKRLSRECQKGHSDHSTPYKILAVRPPAAAKQFVEEVAKGLGSNDYIVSKADGLEANTMDNVFNIMTWSAAAGWSYMGSAPYGLAEARAIFAGKLSYAMLPLEAIPGEDAVAKRNNFANMAANEQHDLLRNKGYYGVATSNDLVVVPAGYLCVWCNDKVAATGLRWPLLTGNKAGCVSNKQAKAVVDAMLVAFPRLRDSSYSAMSAWLNSR